MSEESTQSTQASAAPIARAMPHVDGDPSNAGNSSDSRAAGTGSAGSDRTHEGVLSLIADVERMLDTLKEEARQDLGRAGDAERLAAEVAILTNEVAALRAEVDALEGALEGAREAHRNEVAAGAEARAEAERLLAEREEAAGRLEEELKASFTARLEARLEAQREAHLAESEQWRVAAEASMASADAARVAAEELFQLADEGRQTAEAAAEAIAARLEESEADRAALRARLAALEAELAGLANALEEAIASRDARLAQLAAERDALLESQVRTQSSLAAAHAEVDRLRGQVDSLEAARAEAECGRAEAECARAEAERARADAAESARAERDRTEAARAEAARREAESAPAMTEEHAGLVLALGEAEARLAEAATRLADTETRLRETESALADARRAADEFEAGFGDTISERDAARTERDAAREELATRDARIATLEAEASARREEGAPRATSPDADDASDGGASEVTEEEIARAVEARIQQVLNPRLAQLAQVAQFLKTRKERLAALHRGLKRRARAQRALRQVYAQGAGMASDGAATAISIPTSNTTTIPTPSDAAALETERRELEELRTILAASEQALARRAAGTRLVTTTALASAFLAVSAALSWHVAGVVAPTPALASIDLVVASRAPESQQGATPDASGVADWLESQLADDRFTGVVAGRLGDLGRTNAESAALIAGLADRMTVASEGPHVRLSLRADGADAASAALDAVATAAVAEANRLPERRSDLLRVAIANAGQEVGRAVFAKAAALPDPSRLTRAGAIFGACVGAAALVAGLLLAAGRRTARLAAAQA